MCTAGRVHVHSRVKRFMIQSSARKPDKLTHGIQISSTDQYIDQVGIPFKRAKNDSDRYFD